MWDSLLLDFLYFSMDLMSGKGLPVLLAVTLYHLDAHLLGIMVLTGALLGTFINIHKTSRRCSTDAIEWTFRIVHLTISLLISIAFIKKLLGYMHPAGVLLGTIPAFWTIIQPMPEHPATLSIIFILTMVLFYMSLVIAPDMIIDSNYILEHQRQLQAMSRMDWVKRRYSHRALPPDTTPIPILTHPVTDSLPGALTILVLTMFSVVQHGPLFNYVGKYCSPSLLYNQYYSVFACTLASLFRAYVIITIAWMQHNVLHLILEDNPIVFFPSWLWIVILLLSCNWHVTHISYNLLTQFNLNPNMARIKFTIIVFALAYIYTWTQYKAVLAFLATLQVISISFYCVTY